MVERMGSDGRRRGGFYTFPLGRDDNPSTGSAPRKIRLCSIPRLSESARFVNLAVPLDHSAETYLHLHLHSRSLHHQLPALTSDRRQFSSNCESKSLRVRQTPEITSRSSFSNFTDPEILWKPVNNVVPARTASLSLSITCELSFLQARARLEGRMCPRIAGHVEHAGRVKLGYVWGLVS